MQSSNNLETESKINTARVYRTWREGFILPLLIGVLVFGAFALLPAVNASDNVFIDGGRQKPITEAKIINWLNQKPEEFCTDEMLRNYKRNELLIDLTKVPETLQTVIIDRYENSINCNICSN